MNFLAVDDVFETPAGPRHAHVQMTEHGVCFDD